MSDFLPESVDRGLLPYFLPSPPTPPHSTPPSGLQSWRSTAAPQNRSRRLPTSTPPHFTTTTSVSQEEGDQSLWDPHAGTQWIRSRNTTPSNIWEGSEGWWTRKSRLVFSGLESSSSVSPPRSSLEDAPGVTPCGVSHYTSPPLVWRTVNVHNPPEGISHNTSRTLSRTA